jgi:hypothetical protein
MVIAVWLMSVGLAGALGEFLGRPWIGQLAAGGVLLLSTLLAISIARGRSRKPRHD